MPSYSDELVFAILKGFFLDKKNSEQLSRELKCSGTYIRSILRGEQRIDVKKQFEKKYGPCSFDSKKRTDFLSSLTIDKVKSLLNSELSLEQIAIKLGYKGNHPKAAGYRVLKHFGLSQQKPKDSLTEEYLRVYYLKKLWSVDKIVLDTGSSRETVNNKLKEYGIKKRSTVEIKKCSSRTWNKNRKKKALKKCKFLTASEKKKILRYHGWGFTVRLIASSLRLTCLVVRSYLFLQNIDNKRKVSNVTDKFLQKFLVDKKFTIEDLSFKFNISRDIVLDSIKRNNFKIPEHIINEKARLTFIKNYGVDNPSKSFKILKKISDTKTLNGTHRVSWQEKEVCSYVKKFYPVIENDLTTIAKELDIVVQEKKFALEYNGLFWHSEWYQSKQAHFDKFKACEKAGFKLFTVFEHEWLIRPLAVKSRIRSVLGKNKYRIGARKCKLISVKGKDKETSLFLEKYHIQGSARFTYAYKLYYGSDLLAVMTFDKHHRQNSQDLVLNRFCCKYNYNISGGASKLLKAALTELNCDIVSYSDNRWSDGNLYKELKFEMVKEIPYDYFYYHPKKGVFSKQALKKTKEEQTSNKTEHQLRLKQGYLRVYDCGKKKWILKVSPERKIF